MGNIENMFGRSILIVIISILAASQYAQAQTEGLSKSDCGSPPEQFALNQTSDTKAGGGFSGIFKQGAANGDYQKAVTTTRQEVYSKYPHANELDRQQYADYVTCVLIVTDPDLNGEGRRKAWYEYLRTKDQPVANSTPTQPPADTTSTSAPSEEPTFMTRRLTADDLVGKSAHDLELMRNEIYARHGRMFVRADLQRYFDSQPWYKAKYSPDSFPAELLTPVQKHNVAVISEAERNLQP
jgi:hypothetical protein